MAGQLRPNVHEEEAKLQSFRGTPCGWLAKHTRCSDAVAAKLNSQFESQAKKEKLYKGPGGGSRGSSTTNATIGTSREVFCRMRCSMGWSKSYSGERSSPKAKSAERVAAMPTEGPGRTTPESPVSREARPF